MLAGMTGANEKYTTKIYINVRIAFIIQKSKERVWHVEKYLKMLDFPRKRDKTALYVNYFDIQVLVMVTETETLTSTLPHNIFTYLDYAFSATFILSDFNSYLLSYIYIYIYIYTLTSYLFLLWEYEVFTVAKNLWKE